jgi:hypothetical protein
MGYYMGDFYRGYRGDPGFFGFLGGLAKKAVGLVPGVGPAISAGLGAITRRAPAGVTQIVKRGVAVAAAHPVLSAAGAAGVAAGAGVMMGRASRAGAGMGGAHPMLLHHKRRRHMNVCNPKALRRSIRRTHGFAKLAMKTIHLVHPKKHVTFGGFKKKRGKK